MNRPVARTFGLAGFSLGLLWATATRADCNDPFGKPGEVLDFHLRISSADWGRLRASVGPNVDGQGYNSADCRFQYPELPAQFRCGDEPWIPIALRKKKGEERGAEAPEKPPLKIDFNDVLVDMQPQPQPGTGRWPSTMGALGFRKLTLNNGQGNKPPGRRLILPLLLTEHVAMRLLKKEVPTTPGTAYAKVTLHLDGAAEGQHLGVYIVMEDIDRTAIRRRFGRDDGRLMKQTTDNCGAEVHYDDGPPNASTPAANAWLGRTPTPGPAWVEETAKVFELDSLLRQEAIRDILVNGDDTIAFVTTTDQMREGNNWFAYDPRNGPRHYMPWDVDLTFGQQNDNCAPTNLKCSPSTPLLRWCGATVSRVGRGTVCHPEVRKRYLQIVCQLINGSLSADEILKIWDEADRTVRPVIPLEVQRVWGGMNPLGTTDKSYGAEYTRLRQWIPQRINSVRQQLGGMGMACPAGCPAGASEACTYPGCGEGERRCENNLWTACQPKVACTPGRPATADGGAVAATDAGAPVDAGAPPTPPTAPPPGEGTGGASGGAGGAGGGAGGGSTAGAGGGAVAGAGGSTGPGGPAPSPGTPGAPPAEPAGCQCRTGGSGSPGAGWLLLAAPLAVGRARRARRRAAARMAHA
jgi:hypothetical protein